MPRGICTILKLEMPLNYALIAIVFQLMPYVQTMYGKVLMNFIEPLLNHGGQEDDDLVPFTQINIFYAYERSYLL